MLNYQIKTQTVKRTYSKPHFYILNKGLNSGRPMNKPCPNCFVVTTETDKQRESLYYLCQSLQIGEYFKFYIIGSVIPFIRIDDVRKVLNTAIRNYKQQQWELKVQKLKQISAYEENLKLQLKTISDLKMAILRS
jgi:hypothetical protein